MCDAVRWTSGRLFPVLLALLLGAPDGPLVGQAQQGTVSGTVVDSKTGQPLADAQVSVEGTSIATRTGVRGDFRFTSITGATASLRVTRIGYLATTAEVAVGSATPALIRVTELAIKLDVMVVTGTPGEAQKRTLGNAVGNIDVASTIAIAGPPAKIQDMLSVNVPGVRVVRSSGAIGSGGQTRIRGAGSLSLTNEPLVYIDGVRSDNRATAASVALNRDRPSRINDLNPEEIESIEVLKGPSAATIYGTEASNGVIQIITKRGRAGRPTIDVHAEAGANWLMNPDGRYPSTYYYSKIDRTIKEFDVLKFNKTKFEQTGDPIFKSPFSTGTPVAAGASISGGSDQLRYYFNASFKRDEGMVDYNWVNKYSTRANLSYLSADSKLKVDFNLGALRNKTRSATGAQPFTFSLLWSCAFPGCEPSAADPDNTGYNDQGHGYQFYRPEDYDAVHAFDNVDRTTFALHVNQLIFPWLRHRITVGPDLVTNTSSLLVERVATARRPFGAISDGLKQSLLVRSTFLTADYGVSADLSLFGNALIATTSAGAQYYYKQFNSLQGSGARFAIPGPSDIGGGDQRTVSESSIENKTFGIYMQEQFAWKNRLFLTGALRGDDNSAFGADFSAAYYPKISLSWVISEEPFLAKSTLISQLKLRGAWGKAGQQPDVFSALQLFTPAIGSGGLGTVTPSSVGNQALKPEIGKETEFGFDAGLFDQRLGIEFTVYRKDLENAILSRPLKPSRGYPGVQFLNIGNTRNQGIELAIQGSPVDHKNFGLDLRATLATNDSKVLDLGGTPPGLNGVSFIQQFDVEGFAPSSYFYKRVVSSTVQTVTVSGVPLPLGVNAMCEGGDVVAVLGSIKLARGNGTTVPCSQAPQLYVGRPTPSRSGGFTATIRLGQRLRLLGLVDYVAGGTSIVGDIAVAHAGFLNTKQVLEGKDQVLAGHVGLFLLNGDLANGVAPTGLVKNGFAKLRTVSASYEVPTHWIRWMRATRGSATIAGENLATLWREQRGVFGVDWIDPELSTNTGGPGYYGYTQESWPQLARIRTTFRFTF